MNGLIGAVLVHGGVAALARPRSYEAGIGAIVIGVLYLAWGLYAAIAKARRETGG